MRVVVVTGGIGAGKSTAGEFLRSKGAVAIDTDRVAETLLEKGSPTLAHVAEEFGPDVLAPDGSLDRGALADAAFRSLASTRSLNAIVHPAIAREVGPSIANMRLLPDPPSVVVLEVPLIVEAPVFAEIADVVLAIAAPSEARIARAVAAGRAEDDVRRRLAVQASDMRREALADVVIENAGSKEEFLGELERFWDERLAVGERQ
jgi:dephospho-CoA kinase